ncbi:FAD-dependent oxidoreductase [Dyadobacter subterraneus]|uniref:FAD-dependent monooxygenase n=1 Tax=Dyadobacter subterraneus TaxID=2773304 RepID=A0ABR9WFI2_9BACT|nr:FAD-dependent monooxygenase [Dyadobacter subterraneus]MBE9463681.1 FAD-dependent monooxygenase [Dyadobacter subterraneus]
MKKHIVISGGGIAGLTAAKFLAKQGHRITVLERALSFNKSGFLISLKSFGVKIMDELGLTSELFGESSPSEFVNFRESDDTVIQKISYEKMNENIERSILITRGGLHHVLYESVKNEVEIKFSSSIQELIVQGQQTNIVLGDGSILAADLLIVSEGLRSSTRENHFRHCQLEDFNVLYMGGRLKGKHSYKVGTFNIYIDVNKMLSVYPIAAEEIAIQCYVHNTSDDLAAIKNTADKLLLESFKGYSPDTVSLLDRFVDKGLMFVDKMGMVNAPKLVQGNAVLLGDAGYCPTALSGMGASLSIYGAKALAHFIQQNTGDLKSACNSYDNLMQPIIQKFQGNARNNAASFIPDNEEKLKQFVQSFRAASEPDLHRIMTDPIVLNDNQLHFKADH